MTPDAAPADPPAVRRRARGWVIAGLAAGCLVLGFVGGLAGGALTAPRSPEFFATPAGGSCVAQQVAEKVLPSVVTIGLASGGVGSGSVISADGYVLTNDHVVAPGGQVPPDGGIRVLFSDGRSEPARLVGRDPKSDIAVVKVDAAKLPVIAIGDSEAVRVGQPVVAVGAPLGLSSTVTAGIVSALGRNVPVPTGVEGVQTILPGAIQTDAAINPGNSGGALVDCQGRLIGVNSAIATVPNATGVAGGGSVGIGFAVPVRLAMQIADDLIRTGRADYPTFGVQVTPIPPTVAARFGVEGGLYVQSVDPGGPADAAGLRVGDVVTRIQGQRATSSDVLILVTRGKRPGDTVDVTYLRDGAQHTATVRLGSSR